MMRSSRSLQATPQHRHVFDRRLGAHGGPDAVDELGANDLLAIGVLQRLRQRGVRVPDEIGVVGCDDIFGADFSAPPLTTIAGDTEHAGRLAASRLISILNGEPSRPGTTMIATHLLVRESTGPVAPKR